jgi:hypothetical protein
MQYENLGKRGGADKLYSQIKHDKTVYVSMYCTVHSTLETIHFLY